MYGKNKADLIETAKKLYGHRWKERATGLEFGERVPGTRYTHIASGLFPNAMLCGIDIMQQRVVPKYPLMCSRCVKLHNRVS
jgi:hypothetical protein